MCKGNVFTAKSEKEYSYGLKYNSASFIGKVMSDNHYFSSIVNIMPYDITKLFAFSKSSDLNGRPRS